MQEEHPDAEEVPQVRGELRRFPGILGEIVARNDPDRRPNVLPAPHYQDRAARVVNDALGMAAHQHTSHAPMSAAPYYQQTSFALVTQPGDLFEDASFAEVRPGNRSSLLLDPPYLLVEDLTSLTPKLPLYEGVCVGCAHVVPDVDQMNLRAPSTGDIYRRPCCLRRVLGAVGGQQYLRREAVHPCILSAPRLGRLPGSLSPATSRVWRSEAPRGIETGIVTYSDIAGSELDGRAFA